MSKQFKKKEDALTFGKLPPQALELEDAVLGSCLLESECYEQVSLILHKPECFYRSENQLIYEAMGKVLTRGSKVDLLTVTDQLKKDNNLDAAGGMYHIMNLSNSVSSTAHIIEHAKIVIEKYMLRETIRICSETIASAYEQSDDVFELIDVAERSLQQIADGIGGDEAEHVGDTYMEILMDNEELKMSDTPLIGVDTGYSKLNEFTSGFQKMQFVVIAARPSQGKTALALNLAENAVTSNISSAGEVCIYSLETAKKNLVRRLAASRTKVPLRSIKTGKMQPEQEDTMNKFVSDFRQLPIYIDDTSMTLSKIKGSLIRNVKKYRKTRNGKEGKPYYAIIDFLQLVKVETKGSREQDVADISRTFKILAKELDIVIIALVQLNRGVESRADKKPALSDIRESGAIEQDADIAIFIWHEQIEGIDKWGKPNIKTHLLVLKNKDGECGDVELDFAGDIQKWKEIEEFENIEHASFLTHSRPKEQKDTDNWDTFAADNPHAGITKPNTLPIPKGLVQRDRTQSSKIDFDEPF